MLSSVSRLTIHRRTTTFILMAAFLWALILPISAPVLGMTSSHHASESALHPQVPCESHLSLEKQQALSFSAADGVAPELECTDPGCCILCTGLIHHYGFSHEKTHIQLSLMAIMPADQQSLGIERPPKA